MKYILFLVLSPLYMFSQIQIGIDIDGEVAGDKSGTSVSLSNDSTTIAIGAPENNDNGSNSGHVRVYKYINGNWNQIGSDIEGEIGQSASGSSVSLSSNGSIVAIGAPLHDGIGGNSGHVQIFRYENDNWIQIGNDLDGERQNDRFGTSVSLSSDGNIVAIGAPLNFGNGANSSGEVSIYENINDEWIQIGDDIGGEGTGNQSGRSISLSSDGSIVAIGSILNGGNGSQSGHVRIYENIDNEWNQIGSDIDGETLGDNSGTSISLSSDGSMVAIGATGNDDNGTNSGHVRVYENDNNSWVQIGSDIDGEAEGEQSGFSVSLSSDGSIIAIGAPFNDDNGSNAGQVRVFRNENGTWTQIISDINGEFNNDTLGSSVSLSSDGSIVAVGAPVNNSNSGHVRIYDLSTTLTIKSFKADYFSIFPNPAKAQVKIKLNSGLDLLQQVNIYSIDGKYLYSEKSLELNISDLSNGIYILEVETKKGKSVKKMVVE